MLDKVLRNNYNKIDYKGTVNLGVKRLKRVQLFLFARNQLHELSFVSMENIAERINISEQHLYRVKKINRNFKKIISN